MSASAGPNRVYLDYNASAPLRPEAREAMIAALAETGNPSSVHSEGRAARALVEDARAAVAGLLGSQARNLVFVSGATEAANVVLTPSLRDADGLVGELWIAAGEHPCVLSGHRFPPDRVRIAGLDGQGALDLAALEAGLARATGRVLLALQAANNETGVVQPVAEAARLVHARGGLVACDATQAAGRIACDIDSLGADALFISSHKIGGPKGAGAVAFASGALHIDEPLIRGGGQERGARAGTENVPAIAGFGVAAMVAARERVAETPRLAALRDRLERGLRGETPEIVLFGAETVRLPNTSAFAAPDVGAETLLMALDIAGFSVSSGSACSSGKVKPSHVLAAMGVDDHISRGALRASLGWATTADDIDRFCEMYRKTLRDIRARRAGSAARNMI